MTATFDFTTISGIISVAEIDGTQALFLMPSPAVAKVQRDHYTAKIAPDARPKCLPFISADNDVSGAFLFNHISSAQIRITCGQQVISEPTKPHSGGVIYV